MIRGSIVIVLNSTTQKKCGEGGIALIFVKNVTSYARAIPRLKGKMGDDFVQTEDGHVPNFTFG